MPAVSPIVDPVPIVDINALNEGMAEVIPLFAESAPASIGVLPAGAIVLGGVQLDNYLLSQPWWNNFWIGVGGHLTDAWHSAGNFLLGHPSSAPSLDTVGQLIQLSLHVGMRFSRQLSAHALGLTGTIAARLYKGVVSVANSLNAFESWTRATIGNVNAALSARITGLSNRLDADIGNARSALAALVATEVNAARAEIIRDITNPLHTEIINLGKSLSYVHTEVVNVGGQLKTHIVPELAAASALATAAHLLAQHAADFADGCGESMCETQGPNTDWGKLFKRFDAAALLALLTAVTALDPKAVEDAAVEFARTFGPVLSRWAEGWIGLTNDNVGSIPGEVAHDVGSIIGGIIP